MATFSIFPQLRRLTTLNIQTHSLIQVHERWELILVAWESKKYHCRFFFSDYKTISIFPEIILALHILLLFKKLSPKNSQIVKRADKYHSNFTQPNEQIMYEHKIYHRKH